MASLASLCAHTTHGSAGADGLIWVRRDGFVWRYANLGDSVRWDVLDPTGKRIAYVMLPGKARLAAGKRSRLWTVERNDDGVDALVAYKVTDR